MTNEATINQEVMTTQEVADRLVELCRMGQLEQAQKELYANNAVSIEPKGSPMEITEGFDGITEKGKQFASMLEAFHGSDISNPVVAGDHFSIAWTMDATMKGEPRQKMEEICVYEVKDGKIVKEQFFFNR